MSTEPEKRSDEAKMRKAATTLFDGTFCPDGAPSEVWPLVEPWRERFIAGFVLVLDPVLAALAASRADNERLSFLVRAAEVDVQLRADFEAVGDRLIAARNALLLDGYFTEDEVGEDVAPRIVERLAAARVEVSQLRAKIERVEALIPGIEVSGLHGLLRDLRAALAGPLGSTPVQGAATETMVEIGGVTMTEAQFDAARFPLLAGDPGPTGVSDEATWVAADAPWPTPDQPATEENQ